MPGELRALPGDVYLPQFPAYLARTGKASVAHGVAVCDLAALRPDLLRAIDAEIVAGRFAAAVPWASAQRNCKACYAHDLSTHFRSAANIPEGGTSSRTAIARCDHAQGNHS